MLMEDLEVYTEDNSDLNFLARGGYDGNDSLEIVQFTKNSSYILRIKMYQRHEEGKVLYFTFENEKSLVYFLEENCW
jgi:hypothetical protein